MMYPCISICNTLFLIIIELLFVVAEPTTIIYSRKDSDVWKIKVRIWRQNCRLICCIKSIPDSNYVKLMVGQETMSSPNYWSYWLVACWSAWWGQSSCRAILTAVILSPCCIWLFFFFMIAQENTAIKITLPDGKVLDGLAWKTTPYEIACSIR